MSHTSLRVNAEVVRKKVAASGLSENQLVTHGALGKLWLRYLLKGVVHKNTSLADMSRILEAVDMTWGEMFDNVQPEPPQLTALSDPHRVQLLAELFVTYTGRSVHYDQLCIVFGTTIDQLRADLAQVSQQLDPLGVRVEMTMSGIVHVRRRSNPALEQATHRLEELQEAEKGSQHSLLVLLHQAVSGGLDIKNASNNERVQLGAMTNRRLVEPTGPYTVAATSQVMYAFEID